MSSGFHRLGANAKKLPWDNRAYGFVALSPAKSPDVLPAPKSFAPPPSEDPTELGPPQMSRADARGAGFTGNACQDCGSMQMVRNGTCEKCNACGSTTGCS